jgi:hypothetical protein
MEDSNIINRNGFYPRIKIFEKENSRDKRELKCRDNPKEKNVTSERFGGLKKTDVQTKKKTTVKLI